MLQFEPAGVRITVVTSYGLAAGWIERTADEYVFVTANRNTHFTADDTEQLAAKLTALNNDDGA